ncbi:MAG: hypothetical protein M0D55_01820 [Elusimicrobiota bacterium]|nr:MAG: hypothetical protein M0D55_01820 [Elusimicrobiota bacterium]
MRKLAFVVLTAFSACAYASDPASRRVLADQQAARWTDPARSAARLMVERYGPPTEVNSGSLVWERTGQWARTVVRDVARPYSGAYTTELGVIEQTAVFPSGLVKTVRSDREELNYLRANLAEDVDAQRMDETQAAVMEEHFQRLERSGRKTGYFDRLRFRP